MSGRATRLQLAFQEKSYLLCVCRGGGGGGGGGGNKFPF